MLHRAHETFTEAGTVPRTSRTAALWAGGVHQLAGQDAQILIVCGRLHQARIVFQLQLPANFGVRVSERATWSGRRSSRPTRTTRSSGAAAPCVCSGPARGISTASPCLLVGHFTWASQTASGPAGNRSWPVLSCTARHTVSATSLSLVNTSCAMKPSMVFFAKAA